jgi:hypothetical protein
MQCVGGRLSALDLYEETELSATFQQDDGKNVISRAVSHDTIQICILISFVIRTVWEGMPTVISDISVGIFM